MSEDFILLQNREDITLGGSFDEEAASDVTGRGHERSSDRVSVWGSLPDVCLRLVFRFLPVHDRLSAGLACRHWHYAMRCPSLWRSYFYFFNGHMCRYGQSERLAAVNYVRSLGVYLQRLEVCVSPPCTFLAALRIERAIIRLLSELTRVNALLWSFSLKMLELDRVAWTLRIKNSLVNSLTHFLRRRSSKLTSVCLYGMQNCMNHALLLLSALSHAQNLSSLDVRKFFSGAVHVHLNSRVPDAMGHLQGLTHLSLSYSCLSDGLLTALGHGGRRQSSSRDGVTLRTFSLHCTLNEPHRQLVSGGSWATLASSCPDLKVMLTVEQVINTNHLANILLPEIPLTEYTMAALYYSDDWNATPTLCDMLPRFRRSLQYLTLDLGNFSESLDEELLELVKVCECLEQLTVWAFLEVSTVERLLHIRLTQKSLLNKISMEIYTLDNIGEQRDQLKEILSSHQHLPPQLEFSVIVCPYIDL
ncbi:F-box only protein 39-like [Chelmon rostratus]|uniref:F-box only protein 39-like n=1 Tax=Chelmon rostratus TaxID=109905 RepID=UPI001BE6909B|nr:F-box only protein 39-like [Chelmon rostratus]